MARLARLIAAALSLICAEDLTFLIPASSRHLPSPRFGSGYGSDGDGIGGDGNGGTLCM